MKTSIKLLSLNVSLFDENNEKLMAFLSKEKPDIVCLQEVSRKVDKRAKDTFISQPVIDAATKNLPLAAFAPNWALKDFYMENFHGKKVFAYDFGGIIEYGNYIKTRFPIIHTENVFVQGNFSTITDWATFAKHPGEEPRVVQIVDIAIGTKKVRLINYHGIWSKDKQGNNKTLSVSKFLLQKVSEVNYPTIMCGDFNLFPDTLSMQFLQKHLVSLVEEFNIMATRPESNELSHLKRNVVDYIFVDKEITVKKFEVQKTDVSDHFPLVLEFQT